MAYLELTKERLERIAKRERTVLVEVSTEMLADLLDKRFTAVNGDGTMVRLSALMTEATFVDMAGRSVRIVEPVFSQTREVPA